MAPRPRPLPKVRAVIGMRGGWTVLIGALLLCGLAACGAPAQTVARLTASPGTLPTASPLQATAQTPWRGEPRASALPASPTATPIVPTLTPIPTYPTQTPPPTPAAPLTQLLPRVGPHALLYTIRHHYLMLLDLDQPRQPLWLNAGLCLGEPGASVYGRWSGDGQFLAFVCQHYVYRARAYLMAMQTGVVQPIAEAELIDLAWSPIGSHLLVTEWSGPQRNSVSSRTYVLDAAQRTSVDLPVAATFEMGGYAGVGPWRALFGGYLALMAWSPDGTRLAIVGHNAVAVADADGRNARTFPQASDPQLYQSGDWGDGGQFRRGPVWREDGQAIFVTRLVGNGRATTPSGSVSSRMAEIDLATGAVRLVDSIPTPSLGFPALPAKRPIDARSPDGRYLATVVLTPEARYVVVRDGQEQAALPGLRTFLGWRPAPQGSSGLPR